MIRLQGQVDALIAQNQELLNNQRILQQSLPAQVHVPPRRAFDDFDDRPEPPLRLRVSVPEKYGGTKEDRKRLSAFINEMKTCTRLQNPQLNLDLPGHQKLVIDYIGSNLKGTAADWWNNMKEDRKPTTVEGMEEALKRYDVRPTFDFDLELALTECKMKTCVGAYTCEFREKMQHCPRVDGRQLVFFYLKGLLNQQGQYLYQQVQSEMVRMKRTDEYEEYEEQGGTVLLDHLMDYAQTMQINVARPQQQAGQKPPYHGKPQQQQGNFYRGNGPAPMDLSAVKTDNNNATKTPADHNKFCKYHNRSGHNTEECRNRPGAQQGAPPGFQQYRPPQSAARAAHTQYINNEPVYQRQVPAQH